MAAPIPRGPPVTKAPRPSSLPPVLAVLSCVCVTGSSSAEGRARLAPGPEPVSLPDAACSGIGYQKHPARVAAGPANRDGAERGGGCHHDLMSHGRAVAEELREPSRALRR